MMRILLMPERDARRISRRGVEAAEKRAARLELTWRIRHFESVLPQIDAVAAAGSADAARDANNVRAMLIEFQEKLHASR